MRLSLLPLLLALGCSIGTAQVETTGAPGAGTEVDRVLRLDGVNLHYQRWGERGRDVFLLHGFGSSTYTWSWLAPRLAARGFRVWALDMKGFGWSDKPEDGSYDPRALMEEVNGFLAAKGLRELIFVGHSLGGGIAWMLSLAHPERVAQLVLIDAAGYPVELPAIIGLATLPGAASLGELLFTRRAVEAVLKQVYARDQLVDAARIDAYHARLQRPHSIGAQVALSRSLASGGLHDLAARVPEVSVPTLVIWGAQDAWLPLSHGERFAAEIPGARLEVFDDCGHMPQEEDPARVAEVILDFIPISAEAVEPGE